MGASGNRGVFGPNSSPSPQAISSSRENEDCRCTIAGLLKLVVALYMTLITTHSVSGRLDVDQARSAFCNVAATAMSFHMTVRFVRSSR
jgi:hypothetical protein